MSRKLVTDLPWNLLSLRKCDCSLKQQNLLAQISLKAIWLQHAHTEVTSMGTIKTLFVTTCPTSDGSFENEWLFLNGLLWRTNCFLWTMHLVYCLLSTLQPGRQWCWDSCINVTHKHNLASSAFEQPKRSRPMETFHNPLINISQLNHLHTFYKKNNTK